MEKNKAQENRNTAPELDGVSDVSSVELSLDEANDNNEKENDNEDNFGNIVNFCCVCGETTEVCQCVREDEEYRKSKERGDNSESKAKDTAEEEMQVDVQGEEACKEGEVEEEESNSSSSSSGVASEMEKTIAEQLLEQERESPPTEEEREARGENELPADRYSNCMQWGEGIYQIRAPRWLLGLPASDTAVHNLERAADYARTSGICRGVPCVCKLAAMDSEGHMVRAHHGVEIISGENGWTLQQGFAVNEAVLENDNAYRIAQNDKQEEAADTDSDKDNEDENDGHDDEDEEISQMDIVEPASPRSTATSPATSDLLEEITAAVADDMVERRDERAREEENRIAGERFVSGARAGLLRARLSQQRAEEDLEAARRRAETERERSRQALQAALGEQFDREREAALAQRGAVAIAPSQNEEEEVQFVREVINNRTARREYLPAGEEDDSDSSDEIDGLLDASINEEEADFDLIRVSRNLDDDRFETERNEAQFRRIVQASAEAVRRHDIPPPSEDIVQNMVDRHEVNLGAVGGANWTEDGLAAMFEDQCVICQEDFIAGEGESQNDLAVGLRSYDQSSDSYTRSCNHGAHYMCIARHIYTTARPVGNFINCACPQCRNTLHRLGRYSADLSEDMEGLSIGPQSVPRCVPNNDIEEERKKKAAKKDDAPATPEKESDCSSRLSDHSDSDNDESAVFH